MFNSARGGRWVGQLELVDEELHPATGVLEPQTNSFTDYIFRVCEYCGARLRSTYIRTHQLRYCHGRQEESQADEEGEDEEENVEELDEIFGGINEEDQTLLAAGIGGVNEQDKDEALRLQERLSRQRQKRERTPPAQDDTDDFNRRWEALQRPHRRRRLSSPLQNGPLLTPPQSDSHCINIKPFFG